MSNGAYRAPSENTPRTVVAFREQWLHSENSHCTTRTVVAFREQWLHSERGGCTPRTVVWLREQWLHSKNSRCTPITVIALREQWLRSENSGCIPRTPLHSENSGCTPRTVVVFREQQCEKFVVSWGQYSPIIPTDVWYLIVGELWQQCLVYVLVTVTPKSPQDETLCKVTPPRENDTAGSANRKSKHNIYQSTTTTATFQPM